jgi:hypothetical protein
MGNCLFMTMLLIDALTIKKWYFAIANC